jgi:hypothetical protein
MPAEPNEHWFKGVDPAPLSDKWLWLEVLGIDIGIVLGRGSWLIFKTTTKNSQRYCLPQLKRRPFKKRCGVDSRAHLNLRYITKQKLIF